VSVPILTDDLIAATLKEAELKVCPPGDARCVALPYTAEQALGTLDDEGWVTIGWVQADSGRQSWDVLFHLDTAKTRHSKQVDAQ
jgi:hypothetical protein